jgi:thioredoxin 1
MISRRLSAAAVFALLLSPSWPALAGETVNYTAPVLKNALASGKPVLLEVAASWCPTCTVQGAIIGDLLKQPAFKDMIVIKINFDKEKQLLRSLRARTQSTLIAIKDGKETGRLVGETDPAAIEALAASAL